MSKIEYIIDGSQIHSFNDFINIINSLKMFPDKQWNGNLDAFNDLFRGDFGSPSDGFIIKWINSNSSKTKLGYEETIKWLEERVKNCHTSNIPYFNNKIIEAKNKKGETLFDIIVDIIKTHCINGEESEAQRVYHQR